MSVADKWSKIDLYSWEFVNYPAVYSVGVSRWGGSLTVAVLTSIYISEWRSKCGTNHHVQDHLHGPTMAARRGSTSPYTGSAVVRSKWCQSATFGRVWECWKSVEVVAELRVRWVWKQWSSVGRAWSLGKCLGKFGEVWKWWNILVSGRMGMCW